jgi:serine phosphatase RsbU (regulator of sigma subunit)/integral membrane sensor domain MASE1
MASSGDGTAARGLDLPWRLVLAVAVGYAAGSVTAFLLFEASTAGAVLFPSAGVTLGALVVSEPRRWPWVLGTVAVVEIVIDLTIGGQRAAYVWGFALANTVEPLVGALLLRRYLPHVDVGRRHDLGLFLACAVLAGPFVGALIGATTAAIGQDRAWLDVFFPWWAGDGLGVLVVAGVILAWRAGHFPSGRRALLHSTLLVLLTAGFTAVVFWPTFIPVGYLTLPLLFALAFWYGVGLVTAGGLAFALTANLMTALGRGPWAELAESPRLEAAVLQVFIAVAVLSAWLLAVEIAEREAARTTSREEAAARRRVEALQEVTAGLATAVTSEAIAGVLVRHGIALVADHGAVGLLSTDGTRLRIWRAGSSSDGGPVAELPLATQSLIAAAARTGSPVIAQTAAELRAHHPGGLATMLRPDTRCALAVPARIGPTPVGALAFGFTTDGAVDADVMAVAQTLAELMAQALHRARLYEEEHEAAHHLQQALLPVVPDRLPGVDIAGCYRPADEQHDIGGDWYDAFALPDGRVGFVVGDVVGHDLRAAAAMGRLHAALRVAAATSHDGPAQVLEAVDRACVTIPGASLTTIGYGEFDPATRRLRYACAGHPPPLLVTDGRPVYLSGGRSRPLAVAGEVRGEASLDVPPGALLVWYSDGLIERRGGDLDEGLDRLADVAATLGPGGPQLWCDVVMRELTEGQRLHDDVVLLCLRLNGDPSPATAPVALLEEERYGMQT